MLTMWTSRNASDEDPDVVVPGKDPLRQLPGRLVRRVAEDEAEGDLERQQQERDDPAGACDKPDPELGLPVGCRRRYLVAGVDGDDREDREQDRSSRGRTIDMAGWPDEARAR